MKIWLVNPFDPLPGEREQRGRYAHLAQALSQAGHDVLWWSSTFSHRFKRDVDASRIHAAAKEKGFRIRLIPTQRYSGNVSYRRLTSHRAYGRSFRERAKDQPHPDLILASSPPLASACQAAALGRAWKIPTIIDIQAHWPDNFLFVMPPVMRWFGKPLLASYYRIERAAYTQATGLIGVAQGYLTHGVRIGGHKKYEGVFPLGVSLDDLDAAAKRGAKDHAPRWDKPDGRTWLLYSGSLSYNYDFLTIVCAAVLARDRFGDRVRFILTGTGELADRAQTIVRKHNLTNVTMTGFLEFPEWAYLLSQVDAGFNASHPEALIYLPNKLFYYLGAGAAVLNTIPGECAALVQDEGCGLNYTAGDPLSCFEALTQLVESPDALAKMGSAARRLAQREYDRKIVCANLTRFLEKAALAK